MINHLKNKLPTPELPTWKQKLLTTVFSSMLNHLKDKCQIIWKMLPTTRLWSRDRDIVLIHFRQIPAMWYLLFLICSSNYSYLAFRVTFISLPTLLPAPNSTASEKNISEYTSSKTYYCCKASQFKVHSSFPCITFGFDKQKTTTNRFKIDCIGSNLPRFG